MISCADGNLYFIGEIVSGEAKILRILDDGSIEEYEDIEPDDIVASPAGAYFYSVDIRTRLASSFNDVKGASLFKSNIDTSDKDVVLSKYSVVIEKIEGQDYESRIKALKKKYPNTDPDYFDTLSHIQEMTSDKVHEQSWDKWNSPDLQLIIATLKNIFYDISLP